MEAAQSILIQRHLYRCTASFSIHWNALIISLQFLERVYRFCCEFQLSFQTILSQTGFISFKITLNLFPLLKGIANTISTNIAFIILGRHNVNRKISTVFLTHFITISFRLLSMFDKYGIAFLNADLFYDFRCS